MKTRALLALAGAALASSAPAQSDPAQFRDAFVSGEIEWAQVLERAGQEGVVAFHYWGGSDALNVWVDSVVAPALSEIGITLDAVRVGDTGQAVDLVLTEARAGRDGPGEGSVDMIWLNGENFLTLDQQDLLFGPFADQLPNSSYFSWDETDPRSLLNLRDFGTPTRAREIPWSSEQYVCAANRAVMPAEETPSTFEGLRAYLEANPGTFTYVRPPDYIGNTFVQQVLYAFNPDGTGAEPFQQDIDALGVEAFARLIGPGLDYLDTLEPLLLGGPDGATIHPANAAESQGLFRDRQIHMHCEFGLYATAVNVENGTYPPEAEEIIFPEGNMIANKSFLAIPSNAPNPAAALVLANYMSSIAAQASKLEILGYPAGIDRWLLSPEEAERLDASAPPHRGVTGEALAENLVPDTNASLVDLIEAAWIARIEQGSDAPLVSILEEAVANRSAQ